MRSASFASAAMKAALMCYRLAACWRLLRAIFSVYQRVAQSAVSVSASGEASSQLSCRRNGVASWPGYGVGININV